MALIEIKEGMHKVIEYVSTPLIMLVILALGLIFLIYKSPSLELPIWSLIILFSLLGLLILFILILLILDPKRLQFTAKEQIAWQQLRLSDSKMLGSYTPGEIPSQSKPLELESEESKVK